MLAGAAGDPSLGAVCEPPLARSSGRGRSSSPTRHRWRRGAARRREAACRAATVGAPRPRARRAADPSDPEGRPGAWTRSGACSPDAGAPVAAQQRAAGQRLRGGVIDRALARANIDAIQILRFISLPWVPFFGLSNTLAALLASTESAPWPDDIRLYRALSAPDVLPGMYAGTSRPIESTLTLAKVGGSL